MTSGGVLRCRHFRHRRLVLLVDVRLAGDADACADHVWCAGGDARAFDGVAAGERVAFDAEVARYRRRRAGFDWRVARVAGVDAGERDVT